MLARVQKNIMQESFNLLQIFWQNVLLPLILKSLLAA